MAADAAQRPPSAAKAELWTVAALFVPVLLPIAVVQQRRAFKEAAASNGRYRWTRRLLNRPVLLYVAVWLGFLVVVFVLTSVLAAIGVSPV
jgi:amino acid transporter